MDDFSTQYSREQLIERVRARYDSIDPDEISLGLYLANSDFGAIQSYGRSSDGTQIHAPNLVAKSIRAYSFLDSSVSF